MKHIQTTTGNKELDAIFWLTGDSDYYIYNPLEEALRLYADYLAQ